MLLIVLRENYKIWFPLLFIDIYVEYHFWKKLYYMIKLMIRSGKTLTFYHKSRNGQRKVRNFKLGSLYKPLISIKRGIDKSIDI